MPGRNLRDDAPCLPFFGDFWACPLADRSARLRWNFTGQSRHLRSLFHREFGDRSWAGGILQAVDKASCSFCTLLTIGFLPPRPAISPHTYGIHIDAQLARNLTIGRALRGSQNDACSHHQLLFASMTPCSVASTLPVLARSGEALWLALA